MKIRYSLLAAAAAGAVLVHPADAATTRHAKHKAADTNASLRAEVSTLRSELDSLRSEVQAQKAAQADTAAQVQTTQSAVQAVQANVAAAPPVTSDQVNSQIASAFDKEHHNDKMYFKGLTITPGGFLELAGIYRDHFQGNDMASSFSIPFPNSHQYGTEEGRFSARQSRLSLLVQGKPSANTTLSMYGEFDFLGGAQTANSNESNSFNPRIRNLYGTIDWDRGSSGLHLLAGQNWSLVTMNTKGITPRNELTPPQIDAQYIPGFVWTRQPQVRLAADFLDHKLWVAVSAENPQTTFVGKVPSFIIQNQAAGSGFDAANTVSLNHIPDLVAKAAFEGHVAGRSLHLEGFGLYRNFTDHYTGAGNASADGYGFGGGVVFQVVPKLLDVQFSGMWGKGIGRYGSAQLPDVTFGPDGRIHGVKEFMLLGGATVHASKMLDLYGFAGEEQERRNDLSGGYGVGLLTADNSGCFAEGGVCAGNTRRVRQMTFGAWQKIYQGSFGRAQVGLQYSYTERQLFDGLGGMPQVSQNMGFLSFRYYPF